MLEDPKEEVLENLSRLMNQLRYILDQFADLIKKSCDLFLSIIALGVIIVTSIATTILVSIKFLIEFILARIEDKQIVEGEFREMDLDERYARYK